MACEETITILNKAKSQFCSGNNYNKSVVLRFLKSLKKQAGEMCSGGCAGSYLFIESMVYAPDNYMQIAIDTNLPFIRLWTKDPTTVDTGWIELPDQVGVGGLATLWNQPNQKFVVSGGYQDEETGEYVSCQQKEVILLVQGIVPAYQDTVQLVPITGIYPCSGSTYSVVAEQDCEVVGLQTISGITAYSVQFNNINDGAPYYAQFTYSAYCTDDVEAFVVMQFDVQPVSMKISRVYWDRDLELYYIEPDVSAPIGAFKLTSDLPLIYESSVVFNTGGQRIYLPNALDPLNGSDIWVEAVAWKSGIFGLDPKLKSRKILVVTTYLPPMLVGTSYIETRAYVPPCLLMSETDTLMNSISNLLVSAGIAMSGVDYEIKGLSAGIGEALLQDGCDTGAGGIEVKCINKVTVPIT